jgi:very-short-patch-repair endonuclease
VAYDVGSVVGPGGWTTWEGLIAQVDRKTVGAWTANGTLVRLQPGVYAASATARDWRVRLEAAVRTRGGVVSHGSALALWGLLEPDDGSVHLTVAHTRSGRGSPGVVLHRSQHVDDAVRRVEGLPVTCVERAIVDTWGRPGRLSRAAVRAAAITAVRRRLCGPRELVYELARRPQLPARTALAELIGLLADGCQSELEIWGCLQVLRRPGMPPFRQQYPVAVLGERFFLDAAYDEVLLAVEMDGAAWHGSRQQREGDIRRDTLLATIGWQTLRFSYVRMTTSPDRCQQQIQQVHAARKRLIRSR